MQKFLFSILVLGFGLLFLGATAVYSQTAVTELESLTIDFWPDYDQANVLILLTGTLPAATPLPAEVTIPIPAGATVNVVARITADGGMIDDIDYEVVGDSLRLTLPESRFRVEFYVPYIEEGDLRAFTYTWVSSLGVDEVVTAVQQPTAATGLVVEPTAVTVGQSNLDGFTYHILAARPIPAGQPYTVRFNYTVTTPQLSIENPPALPAAGGAVGETAVAPTSTAEPVNWLLLVSGGLVLIAAVSLTWVIATQRTQAKRNPRKPQPQRSQRKAAKNPSATANQGQGAARYCHECGAALQADDRFCRRCGTAVKK